jgi:hypothetical protein
MYWDIIATFLTGVNKGFARVLLQPINCISARIPGAIRCFAPAPARRLPLLASVFLIIACNGPATETANARDANEYDVRYVVTLNPEEGSADVELRLSQAQALLREVSFRVRDENRIGGFEGDGKLRREGERVIWSPPEGGGSLSWRARIDHRRNSSGYDAKLEQDWGIFRAEDLVPRASTRAREGATANTTLDFELPTNWSIVTEYDGEDGRFAVPSDGRRFKQPTGWIATGRLGVRKEQIAGVEVAIAGPVRQGVRRLDMLALLNWTLPELARVVPDMPPRITIIGAGDPMWRGGLSAPASLYMHASRPLISENGTSTLLHEILHIALRLKSDRGYDWIVEGLAEYYGLELLRRSGTITTNRYELAMASLLDWSGDAESLCDKSSKGPVTALAVRIFAQLDKEIRRKSSGTHDLDDVVYQLVERDTRVNTAELRDIVNGLLGENPDTLHIDKLPGCRKIEAAESES